MEWQLSKYLRNIVLVGVVVLAAAIVWVGYGFVGGGDGEASAPIVAPTLLPEPTIAIVATVEPKNSEASVDEEIFMDANTENGKSAAPTASDVPSGQEALLFQIVSGESTARYEIDEILLGKDKRVVGTTSEVAGQLIVNLADPRQSKVGVIRVNARTFKTDSGKRDRAVRNFVLDSGQDKWEFIEFSPSEVRQLPEKVQLGDELTFEILGDLKIRDSVKIVVFDATINLESDRLIKGTASTVVTREEFGLKIPNVPKVSWVDDNVTLVIDLIAERVES